MSDPEEAEFIAKNELLTIVPTFTEEVMHLVSGDFGPFEAGVAVEVPLWLALYFKARHQCRIVFPDWLTVESLEELMKNESTSEIFTPVPGNYKVSWASLGFAR